MDKTYLFMTVGMPGSGKSFVAQWLAPKVRGVHLRSDDLRLAMFGQDRLELHRNPRIRAELYGAMDYAAQQCLAAGHSVIYDANVSWRRTRGKLRRMAEAHAATAVVINLTIALETARQRVVARAESGGHQYFELDFVERMAKNIEPPTPDEQVITLDGTASQAAQAASFVEQFAALGWEIKP